MVAHKFVTFSVDLIWYTLYQGSTTMSEDGIFLQNTIALIWDFDKTLSPIYMQQPLFDEFGVDGDDFWKEVNALPAYYRQAGITIHEETCYLGHLLSYVQHGTMKGLTNAKLEELMTGYRENQAMAAQMFNERKTDMMGIKNADGTENFHKPGDVNSQYYNKVDETPISHPGEVIERLKREKPDASMEDLVKEADLIVAVEVEERQKARDLAMKAMSPSMIDEGSESVDNGEELESKSV